MNDSFGARDMRTKYGNRRVTEDGYVFDSVAERNHYLGLKRLQLAGDIQQLQVHPRFILQEGFTYRGKRERAIVYEADFAYMEGGEHVVADVKGARTAVYAIKRKLLLARYPHIKFQEIPASEVA